MAYRSLTEPQKGFTMRDRDTRDVQQKLKRSEEWFTDRGMRAEANQARLARERLRREARVPEPLPHRLVEDLGGERDPVVVLMLARHLTTGHGRVAALLRDHLVAADATAGAQGLQLDRVQGGKLSGLEAWLSRREEGNAAWNSLQREVDKVFWLPVCLVILGRAGVARACRSIGRDSKRARKDLRKEVEAGLDASASYLGIPT